MDFLDRRLIDASSDPIAAIVYQAVGAGSTCWEAPERAGVFDDKKAAEIGKQAVEAIQRELQARCTPGNPERPKRGGYTGG